MSIADDNPTALPARPSEAPATAQSDALHALAQPLTALSFILDIARRQTDPAVWHSALGEGLEECRRAVLSLEQLRSAIEAAAHSRTTPSPRSPGEKQ